MTSVSRILLIGMMGSGKTTVGMTLASRLGWTYFDSDMEIIRTTGMTVPEIFAARGEPAFRAEETRALAWATTSNAPSVVSVAGGAVRDPANRKRVRDAGMVAWLRAPVETLARRVGKGEGRPLLGNNPLAAMRRLYPARREQYQRLADVVVDVGHLTPHDAAIAITRHWHHYQCRTARS